jgi:hypothetical protein
MRGVVASSTLGVTAFDEANSPVEFGMKMFRDIGFD